MSKTPGNVVDPVETLETMGTDALRLLVVTGVTPGQDVPLSNRWLIHSQHSRLYQAVEHRPVHGVRHRRLDAPQLPIRRELGQPPREPYATAMRIQ